MSHVEFELLESNEEDNTMQVFWFFVLLSVVGVPYWGVVYNGESKHTNLPFI
jgi:hypothetical protein